MEERVNSKTILLISMPKFVARMKLSRIKMISSSPSSPMVSNSKMPGLR